MAVTGIEAFQKGLIQEATALDKRMEAGVDLVVDDAAKTALAEMKRVIDTTPSSLSHVPKDNRNWTHHMNDSLEAVPVFEDRNRAIDAGWLTVEEDYFLIQEYGGQVGGKTVTPMHALVNGQAAMELALNTGLEALMVKLSN